MCKKENKNKQREIHQEKTKHPDKMSGKHFHRWKSRGNTSWERTRPFVFITVAPSLGMTQISFDILTDDAGNKGTELLTC